MKLARIALPLGILSFTTLPAMAADPSSQTTDFINKAAIGGMFEVESSNIAKVQSEDGRIKAFADHMIKDHGKANQALKDAVASSGLQAQVPSELDNEHKQKIAELKGEKGSDFDEDYVDAQVEGHDKTVALFESYAKDGDNQTLKKFAADTLPTLKEHKTEIDSIDKTTN